jgi:hypothetical protein
MVDEPTGFEGDAEAEELISEAIDTLAVLYPVGESDDMKNAWFKWLRDLLEERAPLIQDDLNDDDHDDGRTERQ